ncbi:hypothetical protein Sjap_024889 [Stephania japonica]|uniref:RING-type E3 ubiquitin transferase n=1 Tax=Stephania japonica TaxID=461633 RepID=A0AAP0EJ46_9MAGN
MEMKSKVISRDVHQRSAMELIRQDESDSNGGPAVVLSDLQVLECNACKQLLSPPVFQCENGHMACSSCCIKFRNKCSVCSQRIGYNRCLVVENIVRSIKVPCRYSAYGCTKTLSYDEKTKHEQTCMYSHSLPPFFDCTAAEHELLVQLSFPSEDGSISMKSFSYDHPFSICCDKNQQFLLFRAKEDGHFFLLSNESGPIGNMVMVTSIGARASSSNGEFFSYDLTSRSGCRFVTMKSFTKCVKELQEASSSSEFLLVPSDFALCTRQLKLEICIQGSK